MVHLTKRNIDALVPQAKDVLYFDDTLKGFAVRVLPSGQKTYLVQYRAGGRTRRVKVGRHGTLTVDEARKRAQEIIGEVAKGENPAADIETHRRAPTLKDVCARFLTEHVAVRCKPTTQREYRRAIELFILPALGTHKVVDITRADIAELHHRHREHPYQANRTLGVLSKLFNLLEVWGLRPDGSNPCRHVPKYPERRRETFLTIPELQRLNTVLEQCLRDGSESIYVVGAIRLLILTGCRLSEIQTAKWTFVQGRTLCLPDSKTGPRRIALSGQALTILSHIPSIPGNDYIIAGDVEGQHLTDLQRPWRRIRLKAGLPSLRIHDLRHSFASSALQQGIELHMVKELLGHSQIQTTMRYAHVADEGRINAVDRLGNAMQLASEPVQKLVTIDAGAKTARAFAKGNAP
ncbi:tyrosine-type recombinase/integrase [Aestuariivirga sp.]|uniref:tyrosine-type recombinase/integrase n=1 Tax=Aestuariivirga sp. TaxID=2650926 RepID=UPI0039E28A0D